MSSHHETIYYILSKNCCLLLHLYDHHTTQHDIHIRVQRDQTERLHIHDACKCSRLRLRKNVTTLSCWTFMNQFSLFFGRTAIQKVSTSKDAFPSHLNTTARGETQKHKNLIFSLKCCTTSLPVTDLIYSVLLFATDTHAAV